MGYLDSSLLGIVLAALIVFSGTAALAGQPPSPPPGWTDGYAMANGIRIHYWRTGGDKPVLLMAHGSSDDGLCWTNLAKELEGDYDIMILKADAQGEVRTQNEEVTRLLNSATIVHVEGAGHCVRRDQKELALKALKTFLGEL